MGLGGTEIPLWALLAGTIGSEALGSALAPNPFQERESFAGTDADPVSFLGDARASLNSILQAAVGRANQPIDLSGAIPEPPRPLSTRALPSAVGTGFATTSASGPGRVAFEGFNIGPVGTGTARSGRPQRSPFHRDGGRAVPRPATAEAPTASVATGARGRTRTGGQPQQGQAAARLLLHALSATG